MRNRSAFFCSFLALLAALVAAPSLHAATDRLDPFMGEYRGEYRPPAGKTKEIKALVVPEKYDMQPLRYRVRVVITDDAVFDLFGVPENGIVALQGVQDETEWNGTLADGKIACSAAADKQGGSITLHYMTKKSPTEGLVAPNESIVLLPFEEGTRPSLAEWTNQNWKPLPDGSALVFGGTSQTVRKLGGGTFHIEFLTPFVPYRFGQGRGNSGVYVNGNYEVQVLDSFGWEAKDNLCGGIYKAAVPLDKYAPLPPGAWQTYDIIFQPARVDFNGETIQNAVITVYHNGIEIHDKVELEKPTPGSITRGHAVRGPLRLQDHGNPVRFRNIWFVSDPDRRPWPEGQPKSIEAQLQPFEAALEALRKTGSGKAAAQLKRYIAKTADYPDFAGPIEKRLLSALHSSEKKETTPFLCGQLRTVASEASLAVLLPMLEKEETSPMALMALEKIDSGKVDKILRKKLENAGDSPSLRLIYTIGVREDAQAVDLLSPLLGSETSDVMAEAAKALGTIATSEAIRVLKQYIAGKSHSKLCYVSLVGAAEQLLRRKQPENCFELSSWIYRTSEFVDMRRQALRLFVRVDREKAGAKLAEAVHEEKNDLHGVAVGLVDKVFDMNAVKTIIGRMEHLTLENQVTLIHALSRRIDSLSQETILLATRSEHLPVRLAALSALRGFGGRNHVYLLAYIMASAEEEQEQRAAFGTLSGLRTPGVNRRIVDLVPETAGGIKASLIRSLGSRTIRSAVNLALEHVRSENDAIREASFFALRSIGREKDMKTMVRLILSADNKTDLRNAENALAGTGSRLRGKKKGKAIWDVFASVKEPQKRSALIRVLGRMKDPKGFALFTKTLASEAVMLRRAAISALTSFENLDGIPLLFRAAEKDQSEACRTAALKGALQLLTLPSERKPKETLAFIEKASQLAKTKAQKLLLLGALPRFPRKEVLSLAQELLKAKDKEIAKAAEDAVNALKKSVRR